MCVKLGTLKLMLWSLKLVRSLKTGLLCLSILWLGTFELVELALLESLLPNGIIQLAPLNSNYIKLICSLLVPNF